MTPEQEKKMISNSKEFLLLMKDVLDNQPSGEDLDGCDKFLTMLHTQMAYCSNLKGQLETALNIRFAEMLQSQRYMEQIKLVKSSSTMFTMFVYGIHPELSAAFLKIAGMLKVMECASNDYRTLMSSFKEEKKFIPK